MKLLGTQLDGLEGVKSLCYLAIDLNLTYYTFLPSCPLAGLQLSGITAIFELGW